MSDNSINSNEAETAEQSQLARTKNLDLPQNIEDHRSTASDTKSNGVLAQSNGNQGSKSPVEAEGNSFDGQLTNNDGHVSRSLQALRWFYARLHLSDTDRDELWTKRGLTPSTCLALGFKSNPRSNKELLLQMADLFPPAVLVDCGLWSDPRKPGDKPAPNPQFYGMSLVEKRDSEGKKVKNADGENVLECVWNHPILIPYFDEQRKLVHLRPHKGMMREKAPRFYVARASATAPVADPMELKPVVAIVTEGEFKAAALYQVLGPRAAVGSLPGITMVRQLLPDIEEWLDSVGVRQVVVAYDNEEKGDPALPGYKKEEWKRFDAQVWARHLARLVSKEGYEARVCILPNEWRDEKGKADWDGALARRIHGAPSLPGEGPEQKFIRLAPKIVEGWLAVLKTSQFIQDLWQTGFFNAKEERIIMNALERISYEAQLPVAGDGEEATARRLLRLVAKLKGSREWVKPWARGYWIMLAKKYQTLRHGYYIFKPLREVQMLEWQELLSTANDHADIEVKRACEVALLGVPERISDFWLEAHYVLNRLNGTRDRLVTIHSIHGAVSRLVPLPSSAFARPTEFREWLMNNIGGASWQAGERELQKLHADMAREVIFKDVRELAIRGYHADSKCWFYKDVTFTPDSAELRADKSGIVWFENQAYKMVDRDHEDQSFRHGEPRMHPDIQAVDILRKWGVETKTEDEAVQAMFGEVSNRMFETIGNYAGWLLLGTMSSFAAGPEIFQAFAGFPGLWIHGEPRQGKTSVSRWMMRIWGLNVATGIALKDSTKVGLSIALQQYGNLPVWLEEFQANAPEWMTEKLKNVFDRTSGSKKTFEEGDRQILAGVIVSGVATSSDTQLKSRFAHVQVASKNRENFPNHFDWFQDHADDFYVLGRYLMRNRKQFVKTVVEKIRDWLKSDKLKGMDERARIVHGAAYAGFYAMEALLVSKVGPTQPADRMAEFSNWMLTYCGEAMREVQAQVNVDLFWRDVIDGVSTGIFGETQAERGRIFKVMEDKHSPKVLTAEQERLGKAQPDYAWKSYLLFFRPSLLLNKMRECKQRQGLRLALDQADLRAQMSTRGYWIEARGREHKQRFEGATNAQSCWCISVDKHPLGFLEISDIEFKSSIFKDGVTENGKLLSWDQWNDPRKGDLFTLIESLKGKGETY
jgi:hypothetical protein